MAQRTPRPASQSASKAFNAFNLTAFTVGTKSVNTINVAVQLKDAVGKNLAAAAVAKVYLSDNADGSTLTATVPTSNVAVGTNGVILGTLTTNKAVVVLSKGDGTFDLNLIQTAGGTTYYLVVVLPDGGLSVSGAITF